MTITTNIQMNSNGNNQANEQGSNKFAEVAKMTITTNIQGIFNNNIKVLAGIFVGGMMAVAAVLPGPALADTSSSPNVGSVMTLVGMEFPHVDGFDTLIRRSTNRTILEVPDLDNPIPSATRRCPSMELPSVGDFDSIPSVIKTYTSMELNSVDDFDSLISDDTTNTSLETADVDYYDTLAKRITILEFSSDGELV